MKNINKKDIICCFFLLTFVLILITVTEYIQNQGPDISIITTVILNWGVALLFAIVISTDHIKDVITIRKVMLIIPYLLTFLILIISYIARLFPYNAISYTFLRIAICWTLIRSISPR